MTLDVLLRSLVFLHVVCHGTLLLGQQPGAARVVVGPSIRKSTEASWDAVATTVLQGHVKQFDAEQLILHDIDSGNLTELASDRVEQIDFQFATREAREAMELFSVRRYQESVPALDKALKSGLPRWQQRFLIAALIRSAEALDKPRSAGILFLNLAASSAPPLLYADMPLVWTVRETPQQIREKAAEWLDSSDEIAQLLGASWLLFGAEGQRAQDAMAKLRSATNPTIAKLAAAQSWRLVPPPQTLDQLQSWLEYIETLPQPLRIGPVEFVADRLMRVGEIDLAIAQWVRIASQHADRYHRAAFALQTAQKLLEREDRNDEAERLTQWIEKLNAP